MSDYLATARTNRFNVKSVDALKAELRSYGITPATMAEARTGADFILDEKDDAFPVGSIALFSYGVWPSLEAVHVADRLRLDEDDAAVPSTYKSLDELIASHLLEGQVAIFMEIGLEKMRYLGGSATAINSAGESRTIDLEDIYKIAQSLTDSNTVVTRAQS